MSWSKLKTTYLYETLILCWFTDDRLYRGEIGDDGEGAGCGIGRGRSGGEIDGGVDDDRRNAGCEIGYGGGQLFFVLSGSIKGKGFGECLFVLSVRR